MLFHSPAKNSNVPVVDTKKRSFYKILSMGVLRVHTHELPQHISVKGGEHRYPVHLQDASSAAVMVKDISAWNNYTNSDLFSRSSSMALTGSRAWKCKRKPFIPVSGLQWVEAGVLQELTAFGWCALGEVEPSLSSQDEWEDKKEKLLALLWKGEAWKTGVDETAHNILPFLKQQKWVSALYYSKFTKFPQASGRVNNPVQFYFCRESSSDSAVVTWKKTQPRGT